MFGHLKRRLFISKIMAEIKAQNPDQKFVDRLFSTEWAARDLEQLRTQSYYRKDTDAPFVHACHILHQGMLDPSLDAKTTATCCYLLTARLQKANANSRYWHRHIHIFGDMHEAVIAYAHKHETAEIHPNESMDTEESEISSEFPSGRFEMSYYRKTTEQTHGSTLNSRVKFIYRSDELDTLKNLAMVQRMGGIDVEIRDTDTGALLND